VLQGVLDQRLHRQFGNEAGEGVRAHFPNDIVLAVRAILIQRQILGDDICVFLERDHAATLAEAEPEIYYETDHIFRLSDDQDTSLLRAAYEGCPIATEDIGHLGVVDGQWIFATDIQTTSFRANGEPEQYLVSCYIIPDEQATILERYLQ